MKKLYDRNELLFSLIWIAAYCILQSLANALDDAAGLRYACSALFALLQTSLLFAFLHKNSLFQKYGLCPSPFPARRFFYYLPLLCLAGSNLWNGLALRDSALELTFYVCLMLCVGFLEELIFRGFLFKAIAKTKPARAMLISSLTFGIGHLLNLANGSGMSTTANLLQVAGAIGFGFLFVFLFHRGKSLLPCIFTHEAVNLSAAFANETGLSAEKQLAFLLVLLLIIVVYLLFLAKSLPKPQTA